MAETTIKDIIIFLKKMQQVNLTNEIQKSEITTEQKKMVTDYLEKTKNESIPKFIKYLKNLQPKPTEKALKNLLLFFVSFPYTAPLAFKNNQPKITPQHHI